MILKIIANFPSRLDGTQDMRFSYLAHLLHTKGHNVELITTNFDHGEKAPRTKDNNDFYPYKITNLPEPAYKKNISIKRLYAHYTWGKEVGRYLDSLSDVPDMLYVAIPSLTVARKAARYCKKHPSCKFAIDIQDLWPEAFQMVFPTFLKYLFAPLTWYINYAYKNADLVMAVSDTYKERGLSVNVKNANGLAVYLGNDGAKFERGRQLYMIKRPQNEFWIAYVGTMGHSYDIKCVIDAIKLVNERSNIGKVVKFVAMGKGPLIEEFKNYAANSKIYYEFTGSLAYEQMVGLMCSCNLVVNCIVKGSAASIINKVGDYALSGLPVINTQESPEYRQLVDEFNCGINCECGNSVKVADAIEKLANDAHLCEELGKNARKLGVERFDRRTSYKAIVDLIESVGRL